MTSYNLQKSIPTLCVAILLASFCFTIAVAQEPHIKKLFMNNDEMRAYEVHIKPGEKEPMHSHPTFLAYSFTDSKTRHTFGDGKTMDMELKAGQVKFMDGMAHAVENIGSTELFALIVELKQAKTGKCCAVADTVDPVKIAAGNYKAIFENDRVRVVDVFYKPGEKAVMHSHPSTLSYFLTSFKAKFIFPDGTSRDLEGKAGEAILQDGFSHAVENIGSTTVHALLVEFKDIASFTKENRSTNVEIVKGMYAAFQRGDARAIVDACAEDIEWQSFGPAEIPGTGVRRGRAQVEEFFDIIAKALKFDTFSPQEFLSDRDTVVVLGKETGRSVATGRTFDTEWVMVFNLSQGKVVKFREFYDTANFLRAFSSQQK